MIEQNMRLKKQVLELAEQMDGIIGKKEEKKKFGRSGLEEDGQTEVQRLEMKKQEFRIIEFKN
jgi:hypothetical protein